MISLRGMTWNHSRGYVPLVATAQRFSELNGGTIQVTWEKRTLQEFADYPLKRLADMFDFVVIDHPWIGHIVKHRLFLPLEKYVSPQFLADQSAHSVGLSHPSYALAGSQYALAIDAATPVASSRPDLLAKVGVPVPETWSDVLELARQGRVVFPAIPLDSLMNWYTLCSTMGNDPFAVPEQVVKPETGRAALEMLRELTSLCTPAIFESNPIQVYEFMSTDDKAVYCPFAYGYSNYARPGYSAHALTFHDTVKLEPFGRLRTTLGGTGMAISSKCQETEAAVQYAVYVAGGLCQSTVYVENGGQPGHRRAWMDERANELCGGFFGSTLPALERAYRRPRYDGYLYFQDRAGDFVQRFLREGGPPDATLEELNRLYVDSRKEVLS